MTSTDRLQPLRPEDLLRQAGELARGQLQGGSGAPRKIDLRRAVSSAYYAVYHAISVEAASVALGGAKQDEAYRLVRGIRHQQVRVLCEAVRIKRAPPLLIQDRPVSDLAQSFIDLQEVRHRADYDHFFPVDRAVALRWVAKAEVSVNIVKSPSRPVRLFLAHVVLEKKTAESAS